MHPTYSSYEYPVENLYFNGYIVYAAFGNYGTCIVCPVPAASNVLWLCL